MGRRKIPVLLAAAVWHEVCLTELGEEKERVLLVHLSYQIFVDFLEQMFLHLLFVLRTISRDFNIF